RAVRGEAWSDPARRRHRPGGGQGHDRVAGGDRAGRRSKARSGPPRRHHLPPAGQARQRHDRSQAGDRFPLAIASDIAIAFARTPLTTPGRRSLGGRLLSSTRYAAPFWPGSSWRSWLWSPWKIVRPSGAAAWHWVGTSAEIMIVSAPELSATR